MLIARDSSQAHELVLPFFLGAGRIGLVREVLSQRLETQCPWLSGASCIMPQGPGKGTCALGACETFLYGVQVRPPPGRSAGRVGRDGPSTVGVQPCDHPQQLSLSGPSPAADARADGSALACRAVLLGNHQQVTLPGSDPAA